MAESFPLSTLTNAQLILLSGAEQTENKDQPDGYAGIDADGNILAAIIPRRETAADLALIVLADGELATTSDTNELRVGDGATNGGIVISGGGAGDSLSEIVVYPTGTASENATALVAAYAEAKALTPNGAALSSTNRAKLYVRSGVYDLTAATLALNLDTSFVDVIGDGTGRTRIITNASGYQVTIDQDDIQLKRMTIRYAQTGSTSLGAIKINAGAGGSYSATNTSLLIEDVDIECAVGTNTSTLFNTSITALGGIYRRVRCVGASNLFSAFAQAIAVSATFEDCEITGTQSTALTGGAFGGTTEGTGPNAPNVFTGVLRRCRVAGTRIGILNRGTVENCVITCTRNSQPAIHAGTGGKFYFNRLRQTGTGSPYSIGYYESATISAGHNFLRANAIDTGSGITNNLGTPYNVEDDDWS